MLKEELVDLVHRIQKNRSEEQTIEVKKAAKGCPKRLYDTLSSFSNQDGGGVIVFGIDEESGFSLSPIYDIHDLQKKVTEQCKSMEPPVRAVFTIAEVDGVEICSAEIPSVDISERPCYYTGVGRYNGSYIRVGDADLLMTDYEIYSFEAYRKHLHDDERPIERAGFDDLSEDDVMDYLEGKRSERPGFMQMSDEKAFEMLNIMRDGHPTLAAIMNFGIYPQGDLPQLAVIAVVSPGNEIGDTDENGVRFINNKRIEGTIASMVEESIIFCKRNMRVKTIIDERTGQRADEEEYPIKAVREAVLNALIHRDYSIHTEGTAVQIYMFRDRMEIHSPGSLYGRMTVDQLGVAKPDLRNPALAVIAESQTQSENRYSGIPTMRREMAERGLPEPKFENKRNEFVVTFYNDLSEQAQMLQKTKNDTVTIKNEEIVQRLLEFCDDPRSREEILGFLGVSTWFYVQKKYIKPLIAQDRMAMTIPNSPRSQRQRYYTKRK